MATNLYEFNGEYRVIIVLRKLFGAYEELNNYYSDYFVRNMKPLKKRKIYMLFKTEYLKCNSVGRCRKKL